MAKYNNHLKDILNWDDAPKNEPIQLYDNDGNFITDIYDELEFAWIRTIIARYQIEGCYIMYYHNKIGINSAGRLEYQPRGLMDAYMRQMADLYCAQNGAELKDFENKSNIIDISKCPVNEFVDIYDNEDRLICHTNSDVEFNWVRAEIKEKKLEGCYLMFRNERIDINSNGDPYDYPDGMFDNITNQLIHLI